MAGRIARWGAALGLGALWWWGVLRLALAPDAGALEGAVAAGGWGLSLLPVHCVPKAGSCAPAAGAHGRREGGYGVARVGGASRGLRRGGALGGGGGGRVRRVWGRVVPGARRGRG